MMRIVGNDRHRGVEWAARRIPDLPGHWDDASSLFLEKDGQIIACVLYNHWYPGISVDISVAADRGNWLTRDFLHLVFKNPFENWKVRRVGSSIAASNERSKRFCEHLGFRHEGTLRAAAPDGDDLLLYGMLKGECRFLRMN